MVLSLQDCGVSLNELHHFRRLRGRELSACHRLNNGCRSRYCILWLLELRQLEWYVAVLACRDDAIQTKPQRSQIPGLGEFDRLPCQLFSLSLEKSLDRSGRLIPGPKRLARWIAGLARFELPLM